jgi:hypothetical protein
LTSLISRYAPDSLEPPVDVVRAVFATRELPSDAVAAR